jgi:hypothetical protein
MKVERIVSDKIVSYFGVKNEVLREDAEAIDKKREKKVAEIED